MNSDVLCIENVDTSYARACVCVNQYKAMQWRVKDSTCLLLNILQKPFNSTAQTTGK